jgi:hypothetical protein
MVPIADSMVYLRPLYASPTTNPQPQLQYVIGVIGKTVRIDTSLTSTLSDLLEQTVLPPSEGGAPSTGTVPMAVSGLLQQAQTDYSNALIALKAADLAQFQTDLNAMSTAIKQAQDVLGTPLPGSTTSSTTTTTTTAPAAKGGKTSKKTGSTTTTAPHGLTTTSTTSAPASTEPKGSTSSTTTTPSTLVSAAPTS